MPGVVLRGRALRRPLDATGLHRLFAADNAWGIAALLWVATGIARAFGGLEKGTSFYLGSSLFWTKLGLFGLVVALEIWPMVAFIRWRRQLRRGETPDTSRRAVFAVLNRIEVALVVVIVFVATFMARGFGVR